MAREKDPKSLHQRCLKLSKKAKVSKSTARRYLLGMSVMPANDRELKRASRR